MLTEDLSKQLKGPDVSGAAVVKRFADRVMADPSVLRAELHGEGPFTRKKFCEFFGVGESTLTGWLQSDRVPQTSAVAYVLFLLASYLLEERRQSETAQQEPNVVVFDDGFAITVPAPGDDGQPIARPIAKGIADLATARQIAFATSRGFAALVDRQIELVDDLIATTEEAGNDTPYRMAELGKERAALDQLKTRGQVAKSEGKPSRSRAAARGAA